MPPLMVAALVVLLEGLSVSALFPVTHAYVGEFGGGPVWTGLLFALVPAPKILFNPLWGRLSDRRGRRPVLALATVGSALGSVGWAIAPSLGWLAAARLLAGVFGAQAALAGAVAADVSPPERRAGSMAVLGMAFGLAFSVGPAIGGLFGEAFGLAAVGWLCASFQLVSLLLIATTLRETHAGAARATGGAAARSLRAIGRTPVVQAALGATALMTIALSELIATFGEMTEARYAFSPRQTGYALAAFGLIGALAQGLVRPAVRAAGERPVALTGIALMTVGLALLALPGEPARLWAAVALIAMGSAAASTCVTAILSRAVAADEQGRVLGLQQSVIGAARALGFAVGGWLLALGTSLPYASGAVLVALAAGWLVAAAGAGRPDAEASSR